MSEKIAQFTVETEICLKIKVEFNALVAESELEIELEIVEIALEDQVVSSELMLRLRETHQDELDEVCWDEVYGAIEASKGD